MKKIRKMLFLCSLVLLMVFLATACEPDPGTIIGGQGNIPFGGERPKYDDMFDWNSGYVPPETRDLNKMVTLSMDKSSPILFAGRKNTLSVKYNTVLTKEDFDLTGIEEGRELNGVAEMNSKGIFTTARALDSYAVPYDDTTIMPYFSAPKDYTKLNVGAINSGNYVGSFNSSTLGRATDMVVLGGDGLYPELGVTFTQTGQVSIGSGFRTDTALAVTDVVYEFNYNFENKGTNALHMNVYQVNSGRDITNRYRVNIDLKPGESTSCIAQFKPGGTNTNALTYFVANDDMDSMVLGMSMSVKITDLSEPQTVNPTQKYTLTIQSDEVTFAGGDTTAELFERDLFPAVVNNSGVDIAGWYNVSDPSIFWNNTSLYLRDKASDAASGSAIVSRFTMPAANMTVAPFFVKTDTRPFVPASLSVDNGSAVSCARTGVKFFNTGVETAVKAQIGAEFGYSGSQGGSFTLSTACALSNASSGALKRANQKFYFWFTNTGSETIKFTAYQVNKDMAKIAGANTGEIELAAGQSRAASITVTLDASATAFTLIELGRAQTAAKLGVVMSKDTFDKFMLAISGTDVTFADGGTTTYIYEGDEFPAIINNNAGADIVGWYNIDNPSAFWNETSYMLRRNSGGQNSVEVSKFTMPGQDVTVAPFFEKAGRRPLIAAGHYLDYNNAAAASEIKFLRTPTGTQIGSEISYSGDAAYDGPTVGAIPTASQANLFRFMIPCSVSNGKGYLTAGSHTFYYWFKNTGSEEIKFTAYQVSSGVTLINGATTGEITLLPGEEWAGSITLTLAANNNAMTIITLGQAQKAAKVSIVMSKNP